MCANCALLQSGKCMTGKQNYCAVLMQSLQVFLGDTAWSPLNVNSSSQTVKLLWLCGKDDISIMLSQHRGVGQVWRLLCPVPNPLFVFFSFLFLEALQGKKKKKNYYILTTIFIPAILEDLIRCFNAHTVLYYCMNASHICRFPDRLCIGEVNPINLYDGNRGGCNCKPCRGHE